MVVLLRLRREGLKDQAAADFGANPLVGLAVPAGLHGLMAAQCWEQSDKPSRPARRPLAVQNGDETRH